MTHFVCTTIQEARDLVGRRQMASIRLRLLDSVDVMDEEAEISALLVGRRASLLQQKNEASEDQGRASRSAIGPLTLTLYSNPPHSLPLPPPPPYRPLSWLSIKREHPSCIVTVFLFLRWDVLKVYFCQSP